MNSLPLRLHQSLDRAIGLPGVVLHKSIVASMLLRQGFRLALATAGVPIGKEVLVLNAASGPPGFFSEFTAVIGMLDHYESWAAIYSGMKVRFDDESPGDGRTAPGNWWEYFFEPIDVQGVPGAHWKPVGRRRHDLFAYRAAQKMSRMRGHELIRRHVRVREHILERVERFVAGNFSDTHVIGIHFRGADKHLESPRVPYEMVDASVRVAIDALGTAGYVLFVATDEQAFLDYMLARHPGRVRYCEATRSIGGQQVAAGDGGFRRIGEEALLDCLLLSRCNQLLRTDSNLGYCSTLFNPGLAVRMLGARD
jgi:hypothetical protein